MASVFDNQISNRNFLSPIGFKFNLVKEPKVGFFCNSAKLPEINLGTALQPTYLKNIDIKDEKIDIHPLSKVLELRKDESKESLKHEDAMMNSPETKDGHFVVPPSIE